MLISNICLLFVDCIHSLGRDGRKSSSVTPKHASPLASSISGSPPGEVSPSDFVRGDNKNTGTTTQNIREETGNKGKLTQFSVFALR